MSIAKFARVKIACVLSGALRKIHEMNDTWIWRFKWIQSNLNDSPVVKCLVVIQIKASACAKCDLSFSFGRSPLLKCQKLKCKGVKWRSLFTFAYHLWRVHVCKYWRNIESVMQLYTKNVRFHTFRADIRNDYLHRAWSISSQSNERSQL